MNSKIIAVFLIAGLAQGLVNGKVLKKRAAILFKSSDSECFDVAKFVATIDQFKEAIEKTGSEKDGYCINPLIEIILIKVGTEDLEIQVDSVVELLTKISNCVREENSEAVRKIVEQLEADTDNTFVNCRQFQ